MARLIKAAIVAHTKNIREGENLSAMLNMAKTRVPAINPDYTALVK